MGCLEQCSPPTFQPSQLFPLFPTYTAAWAQQVPGQQQYWGLHAPLPSLETLISRKLASDRVQYPGQPSGDSSGQPSPTGGGLGLKLGSSSRSSSLFALESSSGGAGSPPASPSPTAAAPGGSAAQQPHGRGQQQHAKQHEQQTEVAAAEHRAPQNGALQPPAAGEGPRAQQQQQRDARREHLQRQAWEGLAQYLFRVRG